MPDFLPMAVKIKGLMETQGVPVVLALLGSELAPMEDDNSQTYCGLLSNFQMSLGRLSNLRGLWAFRCDAPHVQASDNGLS